MYLNVLSNILLFHSKLGFSQNIGFSHFTVCFGSVHLFSYNSAKSEPIWMKSGAL